MHQKGCTEFDHFFQNVIFSCAKGKGQREWTRKRTWDAQQGQEDEGQTVGRTWTGSRRRPGHGRRDTGKYAPENSARCIDIIL